MKKRVWELDVLRGGNLFVMIVFHLIYDISVLFPLISWRPPVWYQMVGLFSGALFVALSGACATLGSRPVRRGLTVLGCGMLCTAVTAVLYFTGFCGAEIIIYFGVLHCLGCCMMLWPLFRRLPGWGLILSGVALVCLGRYLETLRWDQIWLIPFGVSTPDFASSDYFPLVRNLGVFLTGAGIGRYLYPQAVSLWPNVRQENPLVRFFSWWGRHSLPVYLIHQPALAALAAALYFLIL